MEGLSKKLKKRARTQCGDFKGGLGRAEEGIEGIRSDGKK